jgi:preprotein translocase subunit SecE
MKKVKWPSFSTFINAFAVILIIIVVASLVLWLETYAGVQIMEQLKESFAGVTPAA